MFAEIPLLTLSKQRSVKRRVGAILTRDVGAGSELLSHDGVHGDHHVALLRHQGVAVFDLLADPSLEWLVDDGSTDVHDPLLRRLRQVLVVGEEGLDIGIVGDELEDLLDGEALVLRHVEVLDLVVEQVPLLLVQDVFQEVYRGVVCTKLGMSIMDELDLPYGGR